MYFDRRLYDLQRQATHTPEEQKEMEEHEALRQKLQDEADEGWRKRLASRTPDEVTRGVCPP